MPDGTPRTSTRMIAAEQFQGDLAAVLQDVQDGASFLITSGDRVVAELRSMRSAPPLSRGPGVLTSREVSEDIGHATREAQGGPVFITDDGVAAHVLLSIEDYRRLARHGGSIVERLSLPPGSEDIELELPPRSDPARTADLT